MICPNCENEFTPHRKGQKYCCSACQQQYNNRKPYKNSTFEYSPDTLNWLNRKSDANLVRFHRLEVSYVRKTGKTPPKLKNSIIKQLKENGIVEKPKSNAFKLTPYGLELLTEAYSHE